MVPPGVPSAGVEGVDHHGLSDQRSPRVPPGVPAVGGEGVDHHVRPAQSSPKVPPGVPSAGVEGVTEGIDFHVRTVLGRHQTGSRARGILVKVARFHEHDNVLFHQLMRIHGAGDWALGRAGGWRKGPPASHRAANWHRA